MCDTNKTKLRLVTVVFRYICLICAISLTVLCIVQFTLNKDVAEIKFREYHNTKDDLYPSITFCHLKPFILEKLQRYRWNLTIGGYKKYLAGNYKIEGELFEPDYQNSDREFLNEIDYDGITFHIKDYLIKFLVVFLSNDFVNYDIISYSMQNGSLAPDIEINKEEYQDLPDINFYVSARHYLYKCFTFDAPFVQGRFINNFEIVISASIFPENKVRPAPKSGDYFVTFGYPNQLIRSTVRNRVIIKSPISSTTCFLQETMIGSIEVLKRRDKSSQECNSDWKNHDRYVLKDIATRVNCNPKHWKLGLDLESCSSKEQYASITKEFNRIKTSIPPCKSIERLSQTTYEENLDNRCSFMHPYIGKLMLKIDFHKETMYKEIELVRSYTLQNLVGNAGNIINNFYCFFVLYMKHFSLLIYLN